LQQIKETDGVEHTAKTFRGRRGCAGNFGRGGARSFRSDGSLRNGWSGHGWNRFGVNLRLRSARGFRGDCVRYFRSDCTWRYWDWSRNSLRLGNTRGFGGDSVSNFRIGCKKLMERIKDEAKILGALRFEQLQFGPSLLIQFATVLFQKAREDDFLKVGM
jgi:hypothetical protein